MNETEKLSSGIWYKTWQLCVRGSRLCVKILCVTLFVKKSHIDRLCYFCYHCNCFVLFELHVSHFKRTQSRWKQSWQPLTVGILCKGVQILKLNFKFTWLIFHLFPYFNLSRTNDSYVNTNTFSSWSYSGALTLCEIKVCCHHFR